VLGARLGKVTTLVNIAGSSAAAGPPPGLLLNGEVPHIPGVGAMPGLYRLLRLRGCQPVPGHESNVLATADIPEEVKRRMFSGANA